MKEGGPVASAGEGMKTPAEADGSHILLLALSSLYQTSFFTLLSLLTLKKKRRTVGSILTSTKRELISCEN